MRLKENFPGIMNSYKFRFQFSEVFLFVCLLVLVYLFALSSTYGNFLFGGSKFNCYVYSDQPSHFVFAVYASSREKVCEDKGENNDNES